MFEILPELVHYRERGSRKVDEEISTSFCSRCQWPKVVNSIHSFTSTSSKWHFTCTRPSGSRMGGVLDDDDWRRLDCLFHRNSVLADLTRKIIDINILNLQPDSDVLLLQEEVELKCIYDFDHTFAKVNYEAWRFLSAKRILLLFYGKTSGEFLPWILAFVLTVFIWTMVSV